MGSLVMAIDTGKFWFKGEPFPLITDSTDLRTQSYWFVGEAYAPLTDYNREILYATADSSDGTWTNNASGTILYTAIDEVAPSDADYIQSALNPVNDICKIKIGTTESGFLEPFTVSYRFGKIGAGSGTLTIRLLQGTTQIASWEEASPSETLVTRNRTLTNGEFTSITDFTDLYFEFKANT
jgi:hypothetical protein